ncbi:MAG: hypothetical protein ACHQUC_08665, partial [Chlamydiales bacterium]
MIALSRTMAIWQNPIVANDSVDLGHKKDNASIVIRTIAVAAVVFAAIAYALSSLAAPFSLDPDTAAIIGVIAGFASAKIAFLWATFEEWRAAKGLGRIAVDLFVKEDPVPTQIMQRIRFNTSAINELCLRPGSDLNKMDMKGKTLLESVLFAEETYRTNEKKDRLEIVKLLLSHGARLKTDSRNYFLELVNRLFSKDYVTCILENRFIKPSDLSDEELFQCWTSLKDPKIAQMLFQKGFNLNVKNSNGKTPLEWAVANKNEALIRSLQKASDPIPPLHFDSFILDLRKPAISVGGKYDSFRINDSDIFFRTMLVAIPIFSALLVVAIEATVFLPFALPLVALPWVYYQFEWKRAVEKLNTLALQSFNYLLPSPDAMRYIARTESVVDQLLSNGSDITKPGENGTTLWKSTCNPGSFSWEKIPFSTQFSIFKKLADRLFASETPVEIKQAHLIEAIQSGHPEFVEHLLKNNMIQADELSSEQQFQCWMALQNVRSTELLKTHGFDANARYSQGGFTPLLALLSPAYLKPFVYNVKREEEYKLIKALLEAGADVHARTEAIIGGGSAIDLV